MADVLPYASAPTPAPKSALSIIFLIVFMDLLGFGIIIPLLPFYVPNYQEHSLEVGLLFSIYSICQFIGAPILGALSDRFGRRPVLVISQLGSTAGYLLLGIVSQHEDWRASSLGLGLVYLSRVIDGFSGGNISTAQAYISDVTDDTNRAKGMGLIGAAFGIGFALGPAIGGILGHYSVALPAFAAAMFSFIAAVITWIKLPESRVRGHSQDEVWLHPSRLKPILRKPILLHLLLISFVSMAAFVMMEATMALFLNRTDTFGWTQREIGWFFAFVGVVIAVVQGGLIGRLSKRLGEWTLAVMGPLLVGLGMAIYAATGWYPVLALLLLAGAANATGRSLQGPTLTSLISKFSSRHEQGMVFGVFHGLSSMARVIGPVIAGLAYKWHYTAQFFIAGIIVLFVAIWTVVLRSIAGRADATDADGAVLFRGAK